MQPYDTKSECKEALNTGNSKATGIRQITDNDNTETPSERVKKDYTSPALDPYQSAQNQDQSSGQKYPGAIHLSGEYGPYDEAFEAGKQRQNRILFGPDFNRQQQIYTGPCPHLAPEELWQKQDEQSQSLTEKRLNLQENIDCYRAQVLALEKEISMSRYLLKRLNEEEKSQQESLTDDKEYISKLQKGIAAMLDLHRELSEKYNTQQKCVAQLMKDVMELKKQVALNSACGG